MTEQDAYNLGYANPAVPVRQAIEKWPRGEPRAEHIYPWHQGNVNAYWCGQRDYQNQAPRNAAFDPRDYDIITGERSSSNG